MENEDGLCKYTLEPPFQHSPETRLAWKVYNEAIALSGYDSLRLPTIEKIEVVLEKWNLKMTRDEATSFIDIIMTLSSTIRSGLLAKQRNNG